MTTTRGTLRCAGDGRNGDGSGDGVGVDPRVGIVAGVTSVAVLAAAFGLLALDQWWFWIAFPIGYGGLVPLATAVAAQVWRGDDAARSERADDADPVERVERAYVEGRLDEETFERELEAVLDEEEGR
jgi:hypothetical protein